MLLRFYSVIMILQYYQDFTVCYYNCTVLFWNPILIIEFQYYHGIPVSLWNSSVIMEFQYRYGIPVLLWNSSFIMEFQSYYGIPVSLWNSSLIMEFQYHYGISVSLWNPSLIMEFIKRHENGKKQLLRLLERARSQKYHFWKIAVFGFQILKQSLVMCLELVKV